MAACLVYTDGACLGNPGPGGWAAVLITGDQRRELSGAERATTNNRMELFAAIAGLESLESPCHVELWTDSQYLKNGMSTWLANWKRNGWRTADKKPVKNIDLWQRLEAAAALHTVSWHWLRGHSGHPENERCDLLANQAIRTLR